MANVKISGMSAASALDGTELVAGVQSSANAKITAAQHYCFACRDYDVMVPIAEAHDGTKWLDWKCPKCGAKNGLS